MGLFFLAELYKQKLANFKVEGIISRVIDQLQSEEKWLRQPSHQLLLHLVLEKSYRNISEDLAEEYNLKILSQKAYYSVSRETIKTGLNPWDVSIRHRTSAIALITCSCLS
jgi:hypothetical protein